MLGVGLGQSNSDSALNMNRRVQKRTRVVGAGDPRIEMRLEYAGVCVFPGAFKKSPLSFQVEASDLVGRLVMESWGNNVTAGTDWVFESAAVQLFWY